jgi:hypothetical protein
MNVTNVKAKGKRDSLCTGLGENKVSWGLRRKEEGKKN